VDVVLAALRCHFSTPKLVEGGCYALGQCALRHSRNQTAIVEAGGIFDVLTAFRQYAAMPDVVAQGCYALGVFAFRCPSNQTAIVEHGGLVCVLDAIRNHATVSEVVVQGSRALGVLAFDNFDIQTAVGKAGGIDAVLAALRTLAAVPRVGEQAFASLLQLAKSHPGNQAIIGGVDRVDAVLDVMRIHQQVYLIQHRGTYLLQQLILLASNRATLLELSGDAVVLSAMAAHPGTDVVNQGQAVLDAVRNLGLICGCQTFRLSYERYVVSLIGFQSPSCLLF
jgi:hypothetical protein